MFSVQYRGQEKNGPSPDLWSDCPVLAILEDPAKGVYGYDDFTNCPTWTAPDGTLADKYNVYGDTGVVLGPAGLQGGGLKISGNDADNDEGSIQVGGGGLVISDTAADAKKLWFEASVKKASIADNALAFFLGLMTPGSADADILADDTGAMAASKDYIGFRTLHASGEELDVVHAASAGDVVEWAGGIADMEADTFVKLGMKYDPDHPTRKIRFWLDGVEYATDWMVAADIALATFPDGVVLAPMFATKVGAAAESIAHLRWWRWAQLHKEG